MRNGSSQNGHLMGTQSSVARDLLDRQARTGGAFRAAVVISALIVVLGVVGLGMRLADGIDDPAKWGYYAALVAFLLTTVQAAPMVAIVPRITKAHWRRPLSRAAELFAAAGIINMLLFIPLLWVLPDLSDGRRSLWFFGDVQNMPSNMPHLMTTLSLLALAVTGAALLWVSALPDLAAARDSSTGGRQRLAARLARGWQGTSQQWNMQYHRLGILGAFYFMMLVTSHFIFSVEFGMSLVPGWIDALYPATHAANALQAGVATVLVTMFLIRTFGGYQDYLGLDQFWGLGKLLFALSLLWFWFWFSSFIIFWYGRKPSEQAVLDLIMVGPFLPAFLAAFVLNFATPLFVMIWNPVRKSVWGPTIIAVGVLVGTLFDKIRVYVPAYGVTGVEDKHELPFPVPPAPAHMPDVADVLVWLGAIAGVVLVYLVVSKIIPPINIWEQKELLLYKIHKPFHRTEVLVLGRRD